MNFSDRTNWHRRNNRLAEALAERRQKGLPVRDLTLSNPTDCGFIYPRQEILRGLFRAEVFSYAPDPLGLLPAREAIAGHYAAQHVAVDPARILLTSGSSEAYSLLFRLLCNPGDAVLAPSPSYPLFEFLTQINDVSMETYPLSYDHGWHIDCDALAASVTPATRAIILVNPHNPTGMFLKQREFMEITSLAAKHRLALIVDEVFSEYGAGDSSGRIATTAGAAGSLVFTLNGISKMCALPQLKLGWIVVSGEGKNVGEAMNRLEILSDTYLSVNTPVQAGLRDILLAGAAVRHQIVERCGSNRSFLNSRLLAGSACSLLESEGGWSAVVRIPATKREEEWVLEILSSTGVHVYPGYFFDFMDEGYLVVSLLVKPDEFQASVDSLLGYIDGSVTPP